MRILVTGGSGFIGTNLVEHARAGGHEVLNLDIAPPRNPAHAALWQRVDITDGPSLRSAVVGYAPEVVLHMAARTDLRGTSVADYAANTTGVAHVIETLRAIPRPRAVVFASSMLVCRIGHRPQHDEDYSATTAYGLSKIEGERLVRRVDPAELPWVMLRPTSIWGPWFGAPYRDFFDAVRRGLYVHPMGRRVQRHYGFVLNVVHQLDRLVERGLGGLLGRTAYLADYEPIELKRWADTIQAALGARRVREVPVPLLRAAALAGDGLLRLGVPRVPISSFRLDNMLTDCLLDLAPLRAEVPDLPHAMPEAVELTCRWLAAEGRRA